MKFIASSFIAAKKSSSLLQMMASTTRVINDVGVPSTSGGAIIYGDPKTLNYPGLLQPLISPRFWTTLSVVAATLFAFARQKFIAWLRRAKVRDFAGLGLLLLLILQEFRLGSRLVSDFRSITNGRWAVVDRYIVHYLMRAHPKSKAYVHAFHGFGANSLSFQPLLDAIDKGGLSTTFVAHDTPGFGFNPRPQDEFSLSSRGLFPSIYRPLWGSKVSLTIAEKAAEGIPRRVYIGHSMGAVSAIAAAAHALEKTTTNVTLVLLSPAFTFSKSNRSSAIDPSFILRQVSSAVEQSGTSASAPAAPAKVGSLVSSVLSSIRGVFKAAKGLPVKLILRRLVHSDAFWRNGLSAAWGKPPPDFSFVGDFGPSALGPQDIFRYKLASMASRFDDDLFRFVAAQQPALAGSFPSSQVVDDVDQAALLSALVVRGCNVVIVHGSDDRIVPVALSYRMCKLVRELTEQSTPAGTMR
jgi:alpha-beta hydrolase superfamily lysophospholipase